MNNRHILQFNRQICFVWLPTLFSIQHKTKINKQAHRLCYDFHYQKGKILLLIFQLLPRRGCSLCLQVAYTSFLSLREAPSGWKSMKYFSLRHRLHFLVVVLKLLHLLSIFQVILKGVEVDFNFQM